MLLLFFRKRTTESLCKSFINYCHCHRWRLEVVVVVGIQELLSKLLLLASCCVVGIGVLPCVCICWLLRIAASKVLFLSSSTASLQSNITCFFVRKLQKFIGESRKLFERFWVILILQQVPDLSNRCTFALANGLDWCFIARY